MDHNLDAPTPIRRFDLFHAYGMTGTTAAPSFDETLTDVEPLEIAELMVARFGIVEDGTITISGQSADPDTGIEIDLIPDAAEHLAHQLLVAASVVWAATATKGSDDPAG